MVNIKANGPIHLKWTLFNTLFSFLFLLHFFCVSPARSKKKKGARQPIRHAFFASELCVTLWASLLHFAHTRYGFRMIDRFFYWGNHAFSTPELFSFAHDEGEKSSGKPWDGSDSDWFSVRTIQTLLIGQSVTREKYERTTGSWRKKKQLTAGSMTYGCENTICSFPSLTGEIVISFDFCVPSRMRGTRWSNLQI